MKKVSRRSAMRTVSGLAVGTAALGGRAAGDEPKPPKLRTLEGEVKVQKKFIYRYYIVLVGGQICPLYGADSSKPDHLTAIKLPDFVRVRGVMGTKHHTGGTEKNPSPFLPGWILYVDVHDVKALNYDLGPKPQPGPKK